ncbi:unnamed protein product [Rotaria socialis]|uniref:Uncharacterized protein n=3 Tax=Rotaria socialis TaxID=392032 RepID=A0A820SVA6_9BILA|nr:unnamed protein product [Rotaria socialis]
MFYDLIINENTNWVSNLTLYSETYNQSKHRGLEAKEDAKKKANEKIQKYYEKQKVVYEGDACAAVYNVGDEVMVKLTGKKYDLTKKKNVIRPGVIVQARIDAFLYLIQYEYNNASREDWFFVDNITCRTVQEQEQRLAMSKNKCSNNSHPQTTRKRRRSKGTATNHAKHAVMKIKEISTRKEKEQRSTASNNHKCSSKTSSEKVYDMLDKAILTHLEILNNDCLLDESVGKEIPNFDSDHARNHSQLKYIDDKNDLVQKPKDSSPAMRFDIPFFCKKMILLLSLKLQKECVICDPTVPENGGAVTGDNLTFIFLSTCTMDYFLSFIRLIFIKNYFLRDFLESAARQDNIVAKTLLEMEPSLNALDWNTARFIWAKMIDIIDRSLDEQHRSETTFRALKNKMEPDLYEWQLAQNRRIERTLRANIYINCFGSEDEFFANHIANLLQPYEYETVCSNVKCPVRRKSHKSSRLSFNVKNGNIQDQIIAEFGTRSREKCDAELNRWSSDTPLLKNFELKYLKKINIDNKENEEDESGLYVVCSGQRSLTQSKFVHTVLPPMVLVMNTDNTITTSTATRQINIQNQKYCLFAMTSHIPGHFIGMITCHDHKQDTVVDDLCKASEGVHIVSRAFYNQSNQIKCEIESSNSQQPIHRYNLRKRRHTQITNALVIDETTPISVADVEKVVDSLLKYRDKQTLENKDSMEMLMNDLCTKLPSLKSALESDLFVLRTETNVNVLIKRFSFVILYYLLNSHWPYIEKMKCFNRIKSFFHFLQGLIKCNVLVKLKTVTNQSKFEDAAKFMYIGDSGVYTVFFKTTIKKRLNSST